MRGSFLGAGWGLLVVSGSVLALAGSVSMFECDLKTAQIAWISLIALIFIGVKCLRAAKRGRYPVLCGICILMLPAAAWLATVHVRRQCARTAVLARQGWTLGRLATLRAVIQDHRRSHGGTPPASLADIVLPAGRTLPEADTTPSHAPSSQVEYLTSEKYKTGSFADSGGWAYVDRGPDAGELVINCTHISPKGRPWSSY